MSVRREERVETIRKVIRENVVTDQKMLLNLLKQYGVDATQATISRDLRLMGIVKRGIHEADILIMYYLGMVPILFTRLQEVQEL